MMTGLLGVVAEVAVDRVLQGRGALPPRRKKQERVLGLGRITLISRLKMHRPQA